MTEPRTHSGRKHVQNLRKRWRIDMTSYSPVPKHLDAASVAAIENEARAALLDELEAAVTRMPATGRRDGTPSGTWTVDWTAVLSLIQQHRETT